MTPEPATFCLGCMQNLHMPIVLRGPFSAPFRLFGVKPSKMNPNTCTICEMAFSKVMKARAVTIDATVMFADLRGYTALTERIQQAGLTSLLDAFYDDCAEAIWRYDGLLNKTIGDAVFAIFNFPVKQEDHATQALLAARRIQDQFRARHDALIKDLGIGIGIDCGDTNFGEFGHSHRDLTAVGTVVNRAARDQAAAKAGEILVTSAVRDRVSDMITDGGRDHTLKGFAEPVALFSA